MAYGDLPNKLEAAAVALLVANPILGLTGYTGQSKAAEALPALICKAEQGDEFPQGSGNFNMQLTLQLRSQADDATLPQHRDFFAQAVDLFTDSAAATNLSATSTDFFVLGIFNPRFSHDVDDRAFISELILTVYCCASDL